MSSLSINLSIDDAVWYRDRLALLQSFVTERLRREFPDKPIKGPIHEGQVPVARAFFIDGVTEIFCQCGRNWGKTEVALYIAWRYAVLNRNKIILILAPERKQGKNIYWTSRRVQDYGPATFVHNILKTDLIVQFDTGSKIAIDGSDNYSALRGVKPHLVIYDEFQNHNPEVDVAMRPNLAANKCALVRIGTPPDRKCYYTEIRDEFIEAQKLGLKRYFYIERPSLSNPLLDKEWIRREKARLERRGDVAQYQREYEAKFIPGGAAAVFPMFNRDIHSRHVSVVENLILREKNILQWFAISDPGQSVFAVLFGAVNRYSGQIFILDEIYEKDRNQTSSGRIYPRIKDKEKRYYSKDEAWREIYDEAESWFAVEVFDRFEVALQPTFKRSSEKRDDISIIKDLMLKEDGLLIASHCENLMDEIENYITDSHGDYLDGNDHLIDCFRYLIKASQFKLTGQEVEYVRRKPQRVMSLADLLREKEIADDPFKNIDNYLPEHYDEESIDIPDYDA